MASGLTLLAIDVAFGLDPEPLPFPIYEACRINGPITVDGQLDEPAWRETSLGWGLSHSFEPNVLCPDPTLFRIGFDDRNFYVSLACYKRDVQDDIPEHVWKPRETDLMDLQARPRHARMRGVVPPVNTADVLIGHEGRTVILHFAPPDAPTAKVHDALGERAVDIKLEAAYSGGPDDALWIAECRVTWEQLGFDPPAPGHNWALNLYRDIRFFSNFSFISWMRQWDKAEYSRYDMLDRFGRIIFHDQPDAEAMERLAVATADKRGSVRAFTPEMLIIAEPGKPVVRQRYADRLKSLREYAREIGRDRGRIGSDLPYHPYFTEKKPRPHLAPASAKLNRLRQAVGEEPAWDDPAASVARISHALSEAREGLYTYKKERLYRGLPE